MKTPVFHRRKGYLHDCEARLHGATDHADKTGSKPCLVGRLPCTPVDELKTPARALDSFTTELQDAYLDLVKHYVKKGIPSGVLITEAKEALEDMRGWSTDDVLVKIINSNS